jgi:hypothetical protein
MRQPFRLIDGKQGYVRAFQGCTGLGAECVFVGEIFLKGDWAYIRTRTAYDEEGREHLMPWPVYIRIGRVEDDAFLQGKWPRRRTRKPKKKK